MKTYDSKKTCKRIFVAIFLIIPKTENNTKVYQKFYELMKSGTFIQGILFSHRKEQNIDTCYDMDEPQKHAQ